MHKKQPLELANYILEKLVEHGVDVPQIRDASWSSDGIRSTRTIQPKEWLVKMAEAIIHDIEYEKDTYEGDDDSEEDSYEESFAQG